MLKKTCFFIGHRDAPEELMPLLLKSIEKLIVKFDVKCFIVGQYGNFDRMATSAIQTMKKQYPFISASLLCPYHPAERTVILPDKFDDRIYPFGMELVPKPLAILRANQYMIQNSDFLIVYCWNSTGNTYKFLQQARKRAENGDLHIENLAQRNQYY